MRSKNSRNSHTNLSNKENFGREIIIGAIKFVHLTPEYQSAPTHGMPHAAPSSHCLIPSGGSPNEAVED